MEAAAQGISDAAELVSAEALTRDLRSASADLRLAHEALNVLLGAWDTPGWRRRSITDPRPGAEGSVDVVGVADDALLIAGSGAPERLALTLWGTRTAALRNLFLGRIDRDWNANERRGIAALLTVSATLETLDALAPALGMASTRIRSDAADVADRAFGEALEWADGDESIVGMIKEHRRAARQLTSAIVARENSEWSTSAEMLHRLIEEQRATWIVMMLSDGGKR